jgi:hypothetical protein
MGMPRAMIDRPPVPLRGEDVSLVIPDREMLRARVDDAFPGGLELAVLQTPLTSNHRSTSYVEFVGSDGLWRYVGRFIPLDRPAHTDPDGVREVVRFTFAGPPQLMQRREFIRADYVVPVNLYDARKRHAVAEAGFTINVSGGGLLVRGFHTIDVGDVLYVEMRLEPGDPLILAVCRVVRATPEGHHGVHFTEIYDDDRDDLVEFAYAIERARRAMAIQR